MQDKSEEVSTEGNQHPTEVPVGAPPKQKVITRHRPLSRTRMVMIACVVILFVSAGSGFLGGWLATKSRNGNSSTASIEQGRQLAEEQSSLISSIAKTVGPSVVSIDVTSQGQASRGYFGSRTTEQQSAGTGFIISENGYVITNRHVIPDGATKVSLTLSDGTILDDVSVVGKTASSDSLDIAFLKINDTKGKQLTVATIGDSSKMQVGDTVIAIGNALGQFQNSVTSGIISGYGRSVEASDGSGANTENLQNLFQTDAAINQGNSGGPLVNSDGHVIGINTAVAGDAQNIGFSIPINDVKGVIKSVLDKGTIERPYLGVRYIQLSPSAAAQLDLSVTEGAYVYTGNNTSAVMTGSPAEKAGIKDGDIITKINNDQVSSSNSLSSLIGRYTVGETVTVTLLRDGKEQTVQVKLDALPSN